MGSGRLLQLRGPTLSECPLILRPHPTPPAPPTPDTLDGPETGTFSKRLPKDEEEEEEMRKAALSFPGPPGKSHLPGSPSPDHSTSPLEPARS